MAIDIFRPGEAPSMSNFNKRIQQANSDLLNKANNSYGALSCVNILEWATRQTQSGPFVVDPSVTTEGLPERGRWYTGRLDIGAVGGAWTLILMGDNVIHTNGTSAGIWSGWVSYYADRPLQWHDLPLALGIGGTARYGKDRLGLVHLMGQVTGVTAGVVFATLPVQYRPSAGVAKIVGQSRGASDIGASRMDIGVSGNLAVGASTNPAGLAAWLDISCSFPV